MIADINERKPLISSDAFVASGAKIMGSVELKEGASIWYNTVLRGDIEWIRVGRNSNIQDGTMVHNDPGIPTILGDYVTVGHGAIIHACRIKDFALIGMGAIILDEAEIGEGAVVAAGAVVPPRMKVPDYALVMGTPAKIVKVLDPSSRSERKKHAEEYVELWKKCHSDKNENR